MHFGDLKSRIFNYSFVYSFAKLSLSLPLSFSLQSHLHLSMSPANNATIKPVNDVKTILYHHHHLIKVSPSPSLHNQNFSPYTIENASNILLQLCGGHLRWLLSTFNIATPPCPCTWYDYFVLHSTSTSSTQIQFKLHELHST